jgi:branched-chain amino acid transport system substrate-binding protein
MNRRQFLLGLAALAASKWSFAAPAHGAPILFGLDAEFGHSTSTSATAIRQGLLVALHEINSAGGLLGGRPVRLVERDNRSVPSRGVANVRELAGIRSLVGIFCGKFSPVVIESLPAIHQNQILLLNPWAAADEIVDNGYHPNYVFRLSLRDSWAVPKLLEHARGRGLVRIGALLPNTSWGRSNQAAMERYLRGHSWLTLVDSGWYNWGDTSLAAPYHRLVLGGAQAVLLVANEPEGAILVKEMAAMPAERRVPILAHWGIAGGDFYAMCGEALRGVDLSVVQTVTLVERNDARLQSVLRSAGEALGIGSAGAIKSQVGFAHAYDLAHLLARAVERAGSTHRPAIREAMEGLGPYEGLVQSYAEPFTASRREALSPEILFIGRFAADGVHPIRPG